MLKKIQYKILNTGSHPLLSRSKLKIILVAVYEYCYNYIYSRLFTLFLII